MTRQSTSFPTTGIRFEIGFLKILSLSPILGVFIYDVQEVVGLFTLTPLQDLKLSRKFGVFFDSLTLSYGRYTC